MTGRNAKVDKNSIPGNDSRFRVSMENIFLLQTFL